MIIFIISMLFGAGQVWLTAQLAEAVKVRDARRGFMFFGIKFLAYALSIGLIVTNFVWQLSLVMCGFAVGVPVSSIALFVYKTIYKR